MLEVGKVLIMIGIVMIITGMFLIFSDKLPFHLGRLPGDITIKKDGFSFYFPITTSVLLSVLLSILFFLFNRFYK